ncbi:MAG: FadR family transcriptional regulator [Actinobacteria bacterium]|nr:FadR family transcriptional regulator [Actinomycetota bacterium]
MSFKDKKNLRKKTLVQKIITEIKEALIKGELQPGDKIPTEEQLCNKFSVSRVSVREAIKMLVALGVVTIKPGNGSYISEGSSPALLEPMVFRLILQRKTSNDLLELRKMLEIGMLEILMEKQNSKDIKKMEESIQNYEKAYFQGITDSKILAKYDLDFHLAFTEATHNPLIIEVAQAIYQLYIFSFSKILYSADSVKISLKIHKKILEGIKAKDIQKTKEVINIMFKRWEELSLEI